MPSSKQAPYDVAIVGGGPAGLTAGIYARLRSLSTILFVVLAGVFGLTGLVSTFKVLGKGLIRIKPWGLVSTILTVAGFALARGGATLIC
jgi:hypothetical protein